MIAEALTGLFRGWALIPLHAQHRNACEGHAARYTWPILRRGHSERELTEYATR